MNRMAIFFLTLAICMVPLRAEDQARIFFEWGEYDSLTAVLSHYFTGDSTGFDSGSTCRYLSYLGVAHFARKNIAEAQRFFRRAILCSGTLVLDQQYVSPEMLKFFASVKNDVEQELSRAEQDAAERAAEKRRQEQKARQRSLAALHTRIWVNTGSAVVLATGGIFLGSMVWYEHSQGEPIEDRFLAAAALGDKAAYELNKTLLHEKNSAIIGYSAGAAACACLSALFAWRALNLHGTEVHFSTGGGTNAVLACFDF